MGIKITDLFVKIGADTSEVKAGLDKTSGFLQNTSKTMGKAGKALTLGITAPAIVAAKSMLDVAMSIEQSQVAFTTMLGSGEKATQFLGELRDFASKTPFEFTELQDASRRMLAFGFTAKDVLPMLTDIGDAVAGLGLGSEGVDRVTLALGQMQAKGKVSGQEMMQLTEAGIPAWKYLAEAMGVSTAEVMKMSENGLIPAGKAIDYILQGMHGDFGGLMAEQSKTAAGQLSNLKDEVNNLAADLGKNLLPIAKDVIGTVTNGVQQFNALDDSTKKTIMEVAGIAVVAGPVITVLGRVTKGIGNIVSVIPGMVTGAKSLGPAFSLMRGASSLGEVFSVAGLGLSGFTAVALPAAAAIGALGFAVKKGIIDTNATGQLAVSSTWGKFFDNQVKSGKSATDILKEYRAAQERVNQEIENAGILKVFIKDQEQLKSDTEGLNQTLALTASTYAEYLDVAMRSGEVTTYMTQSEWEAARGMEAFESSIVGVTMSVNPFTGTLMTSETAMDDLATAATNGKERLDGLIGQYTTLKGTMDDWLQNTAGKVVNAMNQDLPNATEEFKKKILGVTDEIFNSTYLADQEMTDRIDELYKKLGETSDFDAFKTGLQEIKDEGLANMQTELETVITKAQELYTKLSELPTEIRIKIGFDVERYPSFLTNLNGIPMTGNEEDASVGKALGGPVWANQSYLVGERGAETFVPQMAGYVYSNQSDGLPGDVIFQEGAIQVSTNNDLDIPWLAQEIASEIRRKRL